MTTNEPSEAAKAVVRRNTEEVQSKGNFELFEELFADDFLDHTSRAGPRTRPAPGPCTTCSARRSPTSGPRSTGRPPTVTSSRPSRRTTGPTGGRSSAAQKYLDMRESILMVEQIYPLAFLRDELARDEVLASPVARFSSLAGDRRLVMTGTPYRVEMSNAVDWLAGTLSDPKGTRIAAVTQADDYGADGLAGIEEAARSHGFDLVTKLTYQPTDTDLSAQVTALKESGVEYVFMTTTSRVTGKIIEGCAQVGFAPSFIGSYFSFHPQVITENPALKPLFEKGWKTSGAFAHWGEDVPGMKEMLDAILRYAPDQQPDPFFIHGWIQAGIVAEILKRADEADDLTRPGLIKVLERMPDVDLGGLSARLAYGGEPLGRPPSLQTRMFETLVDDPRYPDMLKPITEFSVGHTAEDPTVRSTTPLSR